MAEHIPLRLHIPAGCKLHLRKYEVAEFDPDDPLTLLDNIDREKVNVICYERFVKSIEMQCNFWADLLNATPDWSLTRTAKPMACMIDQLNELAAGRRLQVTKSQETSSKIILDALINFRKHGVRLVGGSHNYRDLEPGVRENFQYYWFKKMNRDAFEFNDRFFNYRLKIERLMPHEAFVVDEGGAFSMLSNIVPLVIPKRHTVRFEVSPDLQIQQVVIKEPNRLEPIPKITRVAKIL